MERRDETWGASRTNTSSSKAGGVMSVSHGLSKSLDSNVARGSLSNRFVEPIGDLPKRFLPPKCSCGLVSPTGGCSHGVALAGGCERLNETEVDYAVDIFVFFVDQSGCPMVWLAEPPCRSGVADVVVGGNANPSRRH